MAEANEPTPPPAQEAKGATRAMAIAGFATFGVFAIAIGLGFLSVFAGKRHLIKHSSKEALSLNIATDKESKARAKLIQAFSTCADKGSAQLELSLDDINQIIVQEPSLKDLNGFFRAKKIDHEAKHIVFEMSLPLEKVARLAEDGKGLYFNGEFTSQIFMRDDEFTWQIHEFFQNGEKIELDILEVHREIPVYARWSEYIKHQDKLPDYITAVEYDENLIRLTLMKPREAQ